MRSAGAACVWRVFSKRYGIGREREMAKREYTPYQRTLIKNYYENRDALVRQRLGEVVSDLWLCANDAKAKRLWESARKALLAAGVKPLTVKTLCDKRDIKWLAEVVKEIF